MTGRIHVARPQRSATVGVGLSVCLGLGLLAGCTGSQSIGFLDTGVPAGSFQLVAFDSCDEALSGLRTAAKAAVGPYGFGGGMWYAEGGTRRDTAAVPAPQAATDNAGKGSGTNMGEAPTPNYSGTNTHEAGVDEPDLVKTDGRRIVTVVGGVLRVVDAAGRYVTGSVDLGDGPGFAPQGRIAFMPADLLLAGDKALVLLNQEYMAYPYAVDSGIAKDAVAPRPGTPGVPPDDWRTRPILGPRLVLVDLAGSPRVISTLRIDGALVDARQVGAQARVIVRSSPHLTFPYIDQTTDAKRLNANRAIIDQAGIEAWLPRVEVTTAGTTSRPQIPCDAVNRPAVYTASDLLTVLTFDLGAADLRERGLGDGQPTTLVADGNTVYSNGPSLYVSSDLRRRWEFVAPDANIRPSDERTEIYKFDASAPGRPQFVAGGVVPGYMINQYAMSEFDGHLRVATTRTQAPAARGKQPVSESGVYVLAQDRRALRVMGQVEGLGKGERIYSVRFVGPVGYVVTFRQVDPLYTVDLSNPRKPSVRGELKIPGYSAYLHPAGGGRLIGIGQNANDRGRTSGTQVSLFDVANLDSPARRASYTLSGANSEAEFDPHAFLFWPAEGLLVVPLQFHNGMGRPDVGQAPDAVTKLGMPASGALVLRVGDSSITEVGFLRHPDSVAGPGVGPGYPTQIRRSLIIGQTLWTVSDGGLMASDSRSLAMLGWIGFS